jgi:2-dehydro-3-deoxygluconokinase
MSHVVTLGELLMRLSPPGDERLLQSARLATSFGGSEANVAVGLAQFGVPVEYVTRLPDNAIGQAALRALSGERVGTSAILRGGPRLGLYFLERGADIRALRSVYDRAGSSFAECDPAEFDLDGVLRGASWFHMSGIVPALGSKAEALARRAIDRAKAAGARVSIDLNHRPALWTGRDPRGFIEPLVQGIDLLIGNPGAMALMLGEHTDGEMPEPPHALARTAARLHERFGVSQVAITQREHLSASEHGWQAWAWQAGDDAVQHGGRYQVRLVDRVGGGDAFVSGVLAGLHGGESLFDAVRFGTAAGALKLTVPGDFPRTTRDEVSQLMESAMEQKR